MTIHNDYEFQPVIDAINSLREKNGQDFGIRINGDINNESEYQSHVFYLNVDGTDKAAQLYTWAEVQAESSVVIAANAQKATDKVNAKAKLIAGEALTADEADTIVI